MPLRKPVPTYKTIQDDSDDQTYYQDNQSQLSDTRRYSLSDPPVAPAGYDLIDRAVSQLQNRFSGGSPTRGLPQIPEESLSSDRASISRQSASSAATMVEQRGYLDAEFKKIEDEYREPSPAPYLPTIQSGEPLVWNDLMPHPPNDPFTYDTPETGYYPEKPMSQMYPPNLQFLPSQPPPLPLPPVYPNMIPPGSDMYQRPDSQVPPAGIDHFHHDTEAYASGTYSRASFHPPPRSRSPTPFGDDEDYHIVGDESIQYINHNHLPYDPEKAALSGEYSQYLDATAVEHPPTDQSLKSPMTTSSGPQTPLPTLHFGPAPSGRIHRRHKTKRQVQLTNGNLVVELDVPPKLILPRYGEHEMMKTRYTAVTCDPDDFEKSGFSLRQNEWGRTTELFIVITMYNEDEVLFCRTLYGVMQNIQHLCSRKNSRTWGQDAWKKVVVCIVADGRKKIHPRVLDCLTLLGVYQPGDHMKNGINDKTVTAHLFEYTTSFALDPKLHFKYPDKGIVPTQILFCLKERNMKKINSHRWFFNAFGPVLQPNICVLLDVGTRPGPKSIYHLWKTFDLSSNVGGACGEIAAYKGKSWSLLLNPLVAAQNFEYKVSNILDKPTESMFGYISVLPGAFSAYRYIALQNDSPGSGPLASYFKGEVLHGRDTDIFTSNMYLAEDRILCFELIAKANSNWVLRYVKSAIGETDVPDALPEFISQRRRWLNGSFFAATYAIAHAGQILRSGHSVGRKTMLMIETVYNIINLIFSWFAIGNFYLFFIILTSSLESPVFKLKGIQYANSLIQYLMSSLVVACFLFSMGNKPRAAQWKYKLTVIIFAVLMLYVFFSAVMCGIQAARIGGGAYSVMLFSVIATYGVYTFASLLAFDPWHMFTSFLPYMFLSPAYINVLSIYAFCNLDDISWGTKQDTTPETDLGVVVQDKHSQVDVEVLAEPADVNELYVEALQNLKNRKVDVVEKGKGAENLSVAEQEQVAKDYYASVRTNVLLAWVLSNGLLIAAILGGGDSSGTFNGSHVTTTKAYMTFILSFVAITSSIRFVGSTMYLVARMFTG